MSGFRAAFENWLQGRANQSAVELALADEVTREPQGRAGTLALIEAYRRIGRLTDASAERLRAIVERPELARPAPSPPQAPPAAPAADRTVLRPRVATPPASPPQPLGASPTPPPAAAPATAAPIEPPSDRTVLKPRAKPAEPASAPPPAAAAPVTPITPVAPVAPFAPTIPEASPFASPATPNPPPSPAAEPPSDRTVLKPRAKAASPPADLAPASTPVEAPPSAELPPGSDRTKLKPRAGTPLAAEPPEIVMDPATRLRPMRPAVDASTPATGRTGGTGTGTGTGVGTSGTSSWAHLGSAADGGIQVGIGSVLIERYVLESIVAGGDKGGMGVVYRALDRLDEEAQDRNPYKAVKVLNEEFKRHPESIISLHREARKTMTLAHPNILTVFGFERDRRQGDTVFMVMELLEGTPLNDLIRAHKDAGLPVDEALKIIRGVGRGLAFAHEKDFVHSDVKPSNAFYTNQGQVKVLDFGIARAARISDSGGKGGEDNKTKFDAATLGAFTPPYASPEQIEGEVPEKPDDIYALGVVAYELLTGKHPFDRKDAKEARDAGLKPAPITKIHRSQWRTIQRALAFTRAQRPPDGAAFVEGLEIKRTPVGVIVSSAAAVLILLAAVGFLLPGVLERQKVQSIAERLASGVPATASAALEDLRKADPGVRNTITADRTNRGRILALAEAQVNAVFKTDEGRYDYTRAKEILSGVADLLSGYSTFDDLTNRLSKEQKTELNARSEEFDRLLSAKGSSGDKDAERIVAIRTIVQAMSPSSTLLADPRVPVRFSEWAAAALDAHQSERAEALLKTGFAIAPNDPNLRDLVDRVNRARDAAQISARVGELERQVAPLAESTTALDAFRAAKDALVRLRAAAPNSAALGRATSRLQTAIDGEVKGALQNKDATRAQAVLSEFEALVPAAFVQSQQAAVAKVVGDTEARALRATQLRQSIDGLLAKPAADDIWAKDVKLALKQLGDLSPRDQKIVDAQTRASRYLLGEAGTMRKASRFSEAIRLLATARDFGASEPDLKAEEGAIKAAQSQLTVENSQRETEAKVAAAKRAVINLAGIGGGRLDEAMAKYRDLEKTLKAGDSWVTVDAPKALADGYLRFAQTAVQAGQFSVAVTQAQKVKTLTTLTDAKYAQTIDSFERYQQLSEQFKAGQVAPNAAAVVKDLQQRDEKLYGAAVPQLVAILTARINAAVSANDTAGAQRLHDAAQLVFPKEKFPDWKRDRAAAQPTQQTQQTQQQGQPAGQAQQVQQPQQTQAVQQTQQPNQTQQVQQPIRDAPPLQVFPPPPRVESKACAPEFAGKGRSLRAQCFDSLSAGGKGPDLVVVSINGRTLSIMRDEASNADYAKYCSSAGCAVPAGAAAMPVTSVSVADATKYADWLSAQTGAKYRLPTDAEWTAASAASSVDANGINCVFSMRGTAIRSAGQGTPNDFGLRDVLGNVQEWVSGEGGGWRARGGAAGDPLEDCQKAPNRGHPGNPDGKTGFRLVRENK